MDEFLKANYTLLTSTFEFIAAISGVIYYKKYKHTPIKYFVFFLCFIAIAELLSLYTYLVKNEGLFWFLNGTLLQRNYWWGTLYWTIGSVMFYSFYFSKVIKTSNYLLILKFSRYLFLAFSLIYIITHLDEYFIRSFPAINISGAIVIFMCVFLYFIELLQSNKILKFHKSISFYISSVILIWWLIITPLVFYQVYFNNVDWNFIFLKWQIYLFANIFMYLTFTFALIWCKKESD